MQIQLDCDESNVEEYTGLLYCGVYNTCTVREIFWLWLKIYLATWQVETILGNGVLGRNCTWQVYLVETILGKYTWLKLYLARASKHMWRSSCCIDKAKRGRRIHVAVDVRVYWDVHTGTRHLHNGEKSMYEECIGLFTQA